MTATANVSEFIGEIDVALDQMDADVNAFVRRICLEALSRIVLKTPVDTGRARGNWNVGIGEIDETTDFELFDKTGSKSLRRGGKEIGKYAREDGFPNVYISNNLPYANRLENGWSKQAPKGMVALTAIELSTRRVEA